MAKRSGKRQKKAAPVASGSKRKEVNEFLGRILDSLKRDDGLQEAGELVAELSRIVGPTRSHGIMDVVVCIARAYGALGNTAERDEWLRAAASLAEERAARIEDEALREKYLRSSFSRARGDSLHVDSVE